MFYLSLDIDCRAVRTHEDRMRKEHLSGRLPRPIKVREEDKPPFEYDPDLPWMYIRQKPKPKLRVWFDDDGEYLGSIFLFCCFLLIICILAMMVVMVMATILTQKLLFLSLSLSLLFSYHHIGPTW